MLEFFHFLHMMAGVAFGGASLLFAWVVAPALVQMEPEARAAHFDTLVRYATPFMATTGILALVGGIGRAWTAGPIDRFRDLLSGYGLMVTLALVVFIVWGAFDGRNRGRMAKAIAAKDNEALAREVGTSRTVTSAALLVILGLMGAMRLGLY